MAAIAVIVGMVVVGIIVVAIVMVAMMSSFRVVLVGNRRRRPVFSFRMAAAAAAAVDPQCGPPFPRAAVSRIRDSRQAVGSAKNVVERKKVERAVASS